VKRLCVIVPAIYLLSGFLSTITDAEEIRVAVASNFSGAAKAVSSRFEANSDHRVTLVFGSTGKHYAQIHNGAPFDLFFAADARRPELLEKEGLCVAGSRFTYAQGRLILWSARDNYVDPAGGVLGSDFHHLAIANPQHAPYGRAARETLETLGLWNEVQKRLVRGENIGQTFHFVKSGNAELGFVAYSQIRIPGAPAGGSYWEVPSSMYGPIYQQAVLLRDAPVARAFLEFMQSDEAREIIRGYGYIIPEER